MYESLLIKLYIVKKNISFVEKKNKKLMCREE